MRKKTQPEFVCLNQKRTGTVAYTNFTSGNIDFFFLNKVIIILDGMATISLIEYPCIFLALLG